MPLLRALLLGALLQTSIAYSATWITVEVPDSSSTLAYGINDSEEIVGSYTDASRFIHGFLLRNGVYTTLDVPGALTTAARAINNTDQVVGWFFDGKKQRGFIFDEQNYVVLDVPGALQTQALGINDAGQVVGTYVDSRSKTHGFSYINGHFTTLDFPGSEFTSLSGINNRGHIVGVFIDAKDLDHGFVENTNGKLRRLGPDLDSNAINDHNVVVGFRGDAGFWFNLRNYTFRLLQFPGAASTKCYGVSTSGDVVGIYQDTKDLPHAFLRTR